MTELLYRIGHWLSARTEFLVKSGVEVFIIFLFIYAFLRLMQGTRGAGGRTSGTGGSAPP